MDSLPPGSGFSLPTGESNQPREEGACPEGRGQCEMPLGIFEIHSPQAERDTVYSILQLAVGCSLGCVSSAEPFMGGALELGSSPRGDLGLGQVNRS